MAFDDTEDRLKALRPGVLATLKYRLHEGDPKAPRTFIFYVQRPRPDDEELRGVLDGMIAELVAKVHAGTEGRFFRVYYSALTDDRGELTLSAHVEHWPKTEGDE